MFTIYDHFFYSLFLQFISFPFQKGKRNCYELGRALRTRYAEFLNASYHYSLIEGKSTHFGRSKESLQVVLAGLFPPTKELTWFEGINWLPIATYYDKQGTEEVRRPQYVEIVTAVSDYYYKEFLCSHMQENNWSLLLILLTVDCLEWMT